MNISELRRLLEKRLSIDEIQTLWFDVFQNSMIDYANLSPKDAAIRTLLERVQQLKLEDKLVENLGKNRADLKPDLKALDRKMPGLSEGYALDEPPQKREEDYLRLSVNSDWLRNGSIVLLQTQNYNFSKSTWLAFKVRTNRIGLASSTDESSNITKWRVSVVGSSDIIHLSPHGQLNNYLDGRTQDGTVGLAPSTEGHYTGTKWQVYFNNDGTVGLKTLGHIPGLHWLDGIPEDTDVRLVDSPQDSPGTKWKVFQGKLNN